MLKPIINRLRPKMEQAVAKLEEELRTIRTGQANPAMVENVKVSYYGSNLPLKQLANISVPDPNLIVVQPWDINSLGDIEMGIQNSNLNLNPNNDGKVIRLNLPPVTAERRKELVKMIHHQAEGSKVLLRNLREEAWREIQELQKRGQLTEDDRYSGEKELNDIIRDFNQKIINLISNKEEEIKKV